MSRGPQRHQFYGRRKGHALRRHHLRLVEELLPRLRVDLANPVPNEKRGPRLRGGDEAGGISHPLRHPREGGDPALRPCWLEIGFGGGEHLAHQAELHPEVSFIGAEPFLNGVAKLLALIEAEGLSNIRVFDGDARYLLEALPDASLERIYLLYPDPWPKARHHKRRLVSPANLAIFHRLLKPGGLFLFASDSGDYVTWTLEQVAAHSGFVLEGDPAQPFENWVETRYEAKARKVGQTAWYLTFRRSGAPPSTA